MAITNTKIRLYGSLSKTPLLKEYDVQSEVSSVECDGLDNGRTYYATAQVTNDRGVTSDESATYMFRTYADAVWFGREPFVNADGNIEFNVRYNTNDVQVSHVGVEWSKSSTFDIKMMMWSDFNDYQDIIEDLEEHTTYYVRPYNEDSYGRRYINTAQTVSLTTGYAKPVITVTTPSVTATSAVGTITVESTSPLTALTARLLSKGVYTDIPVSVQTGTQNWTMECLTEATEYTLVVTATNASGETQNESVFTTASVVVSVDMDSIELGSDTSHSVVASANCSVTGAQLNTLTIALFSENSHQGVPDFTYSVTGSTTVEHTFTNLDPGHQYYAFAEVTYTVGNTGCLETRSKWSASKSVLTTPVFVFGDLTATTNSITVPYATIGTTTSTQLEYSLNGTSGWNPIYQSSPAEITGLEPDTTYYFRGRAANTSGYGEYVMVSKTTSESIPVVVINDVSDITPVSAKVSISVTNNED